MFLQLIYLVILIILILAVKLTKADILGYNAIPELGKYTTQ